MTYTLASFCGKPHEIKAQIAHWGSMIEQDIEAIARSTQWEFMNSEVGTLQDVSTGMGGKSLEVDDGIEPQNTKPRKRKPKRDRAWRREQREKKIEERFAAVGDEDAGLDQSIVDEMQETLSEYSIEAKLDPDMSVAELEQEWARLGLRRDYLIVLVQHAVKRFGEKRFVEIYHEYKSGKLEVGRVLERNVVFAPETVYVQDKKTGLYKKMSHLARRLEAKREEIKDPEVVIQRMKEMVALGRYSRLLKVAHGRPKGKLAKGISRGYGNPRRKGYGDKWRHQMELRAIRKEVREELNEFDSLPKY